MALNNRFPWTKSRSLPVPDGTPSGAPVKVGGFVGVTLTKQKTAGDNDYGNGNKPGEATVALDGQWNLPVTGAVTNVGDAVYIDGSNALTTTATGNTAFGLAAALKPAAAGVIPVEIA